MEGIDGPDRKRFPIVIGDAADFAIVRSLLERSGFTSDAICRTFNITRMSDLSSVGREDFDLSTCEPAALATLIRLFLYSDPMLKHDLIATLGPAEFESLARLGLIYPVASKDGPALAAPVILYPVEGYFIASDLHQSTDDEPAAAEMDRVFPAIHAGTALFLRLMPRQPARSVLDLCSGTGIAAIILSDIAQASVASDVTARAVHFAEFNARLNGRSNVRPERSDVFEGLGGETFDRIVAHPPYVPSLTPSEIFRDGGETGERIVKRIIEGLPRHLDRGGNFFALLVGLDTKEAPFQARIRQWLGDREVDFDILFAVSDEQSPRAFSKEITELTHANPDTLIKWNEVFDRDGVRQLAYGALAVFRRGPEQPFSGTVAPITERLRLGSHSNGQSFELAFRTYYLTRNADGIEALAETKPRLAPALSLKVTHVVSECELIPSRFELHVDEPFITDTVVDGWIVAVMAELRGHLSLAGLYEAAKNNHALPETMSRHDFLLLMAKLAERGYLLLD